MNIFNNLQQQYDQLWKYIIRPTRNVYPQKNLGPQTFQLEGKKIKRVDFRVMNPRGYVLFCSHFIPLQQEHYPCVIYMHGNSSNRTEGMEYLGHLIRQNISLCTFDFSGCGNSQGDYVSLGFYQQDDLKEVISTIKRKPQITSIALWGRSMGSVTALLYLRKSNDICAAVFDSPFKSLRSLIQDLCKKNSKIPNIIVSGALKIISGTIQEKAKFDIYKLNPLKYEVPFLTCPAFFLVGMQDDMIPPQHTLTLFEKYKGQNKTLQKVKGNHNDSRPQQCVQKIVDFLMSHMKKDTKTEVLKEVQTSNNQRKQEFNFFDDDNQIQNSSKQAQKFDFFSVDIQAKEQQTIGETNFQFSKPQKNLSENKSSIISLTSILSNVFQGGNTTKKEQSIKRGQDGYEITIQKIAKQLSIQNTAFINDIKARKEINQKSNRKQIKQVRNNSFEREILANLQTWAF